MCASVVRSSAHFHAVAADVAGKNMTRTPTLCALSSGSVKTILTSFTFKLMLATIRLSAALSPKATTIVSPTISPGAAATLIWVAPAGAFFFKGCIDGGPAGGAGIAAGVGRIGNIEQMEHAPHCPALHLTTQGSESA